METKETTKCEIEEIEREMQQKPRIKHAVNPKHHFARIVDNIFKCTTRI